VTGFTVSLSYFFVVFVSFVRFVVKNHNLTPIRLRASKGTFALQNQTMRL